MFTLDTQAERLNKDRYKIMAVVLMGVFMSVLDTNVVNVALPTITSYFHVDLAQSQWVVTTYLIVLTSFLLIFGRLSERVGKARLFIFGFLIFTVSSLACGLSNSIEMLIACRALQGIGASIALSIDMAILMQAFPQYERGKAFGFLATTIAIGSIAGPIIGGFVVGLVGWQYVFFINVPVGIALIAAALKYMKLEETKVERLNMDWIGAASLVSLIVSLMLLLGSLAQRIELSVESGVYAAILAASLAVFLYVELTRKNPMVDLSLFRIKKFSFSNLSTICNYSAFSMFNVVMPFYLEMSLGYKPAQVGQVLFVIPILIAITAPISGWLYDKRQTNTHSSLGIFFMALSLLLIGYHAPSMSTPLLLGCFALYGIGNGLFLSTNNSVAMSSLPAHRNSAAASTLATVRNTGSTVGVSLVSILLYMSVTASGVSEVTSAGTALLSHAAGNVLMFAGLICVAGFVCTLLIGWK